MQKPAPENKVLKPQDNKSTKQTDSQPASDDDQKEQDK